MTRWLCRGAAALLGALMLIGVSALGASAASTDNSRDEAIKLLEVTRQSIDRTLRSQSYSVRGVSVTRPKLTDLIEAIKQLDQMANLSASACSVGMIGRPTYPQ